MATVVTGATGLVGNNLVRRLLAEGRDVRVLARQPADSPALAGLDVRLFAGDLRDAESIRRACEGAEAVLHAAGWVHIGWSGLDRAREINVAGTRNVALAAREAGIRMVHVSTINAIGDPGSGAVSDEETPAANLVACPYVVTKQEAEQEILKLASDGLDAVIVNPGFMLGPWDWKPSSGRMLLEVAKAFTPFAPRGGVATSDVRDVAGGILAALAKGKTGRRYILGGHNTSYLDLWRLFAEISRSSSPRYRMGPLESWIGGLAGDLAARLSGREGNVNSAATRMGAQKHYYSSRRAEEELGFAARPVQEAAEGAWEWFCERGYVKRPAS